MYETGKVQSSVTINEAISQNNITPFTYNLRAEALIILVLPCGSSIF